MPFVFTGRFYALLALGFLALPFLHTPRAGWLFLAGYDLLLLTLAVGDYFLLPAPDRFEVTRRHEPRLYLGAENVITLLVYNRSAMDVELLLKDDYPPEFAVRGRTLAVTAPARQTVSATYAAFPPNRGQYDFGAIHMRYRSGLRLVYRQARFAAAESVKVYPNVRELRKHELLGVRRREMDLGQRLSRHKGEAREFESLREYIPGDDYRHIAWTATARRSKLVTREYQIERSQNILLAIDTGRLMTARLSDFNKLDYAINAALAMAYVALRRGDRVGLLLFGRDVHTFLPPRSGKGVINELLEAVYPVQPELVESSYRRALRTIATRMKRRSLVLILTDLVGSLRAEALALSDLVRYTRLLLPRHLPVIVTLGNEELTALTRERPADVEMLLHQSVGEELLAAREAVLARLRDLGALTLDVSPARITPELINQYLEIKARGLL